MMKYELTKLMESFFLKFVKILPKRLKYWVVVDLWAYHSVHTWPSIHVDEISMMMILKQTGKELDE